MNKDLRMNILSTTFFKNEKDCEKIDGSKILCGSSENAQVGLPTGKPT
jgi:hypothetical protein